jgi:hypothetical protein
MISERRRPVSVDGILFYRGGREEDPETEKKVTEIIEFLCPPGYISRERNALERVYEEKKRKYLRLAMSFKRLQREHAQITAVIVSSMGAVYDQSLKDLQKVLGCTDQEMRKLGRKMSETVIMSSVEVWQQDAHEIERGREDAANALVEEEIAILDAKVPEQEAEMRMEEYIALKTEGKPARERGREGEDVDGRDEDDPADGLGNANFLIDPGFVKTILAHSQNKFHNCPIGHSVQVHGFPFPPKRLSPGKDP